MRIAGDKYQWLHAWEACVAALTDRADGSENPVTAVGVEVAGAGNLDDVVRCRREPPHSYSQIKYAVDARTSVGTDYLLRPSNSGGPSVLGKIAEAWRRLTADGAPVELALITNRSLDSSDPLVSRCDARTMLLMPGASEGGPNSAQGMARRRWAEATGLSEAELLELLKVLRFDAGYPVPRLHAALAAQMRAIGLPAEDKDIEAGANWIARQVQAGYTELDLTAIDQAVADLWPQCHLTLRNDGQASRSPLRLDMPELDSVDSLLAFANTAITRVGRDRELLELRSFLESESAFSWWLWTGPAGAGKSRLAIELCRAVSTSWHAGFLREDQESALENIQPTRPTLVVVDYAAERSEWLSDALFRLSRRALSAPVRVLILERRADGPWWNRVQRTHRMEESFQIQACNYALQRELGGLSRPEIRKLVKVVAERAGSTLSSTNVEDIADHLEKIDPARRPLFVLVATMDWLDEKDVSTDRDAALRRLIARAEGQTAQTVTNSVNALHVRNVRTFATALGGVTADAYAQIMHTPHPPVGLLPDVYSDFHPVSLDDLLNGLRPDILGELYVLDRLATTGVEQLATGALLRLAWRADEEAYRAFVERAAGDHKDHPQLIDLLDAGDWTASPMFCARMAVNIIPLLQRSEHPTLVWIFSRLDSARQSNPMQALEEISATARFRLANLVLNEGSTDRANMLYTDALAACKPGWEVRFSILNNRGITWLKLNDRRSAMADFAAVIETASATDEVRACALNNRADVFDAEDDTDSAIADRTAVLDLAETTYNRRFIALVRRAQAWWKQGDQGRAYEDIISILAMDDIATEQKMAARLQRAEWLAEAGADSDALIDLKIVIASRRNFDGVEARSRQIVTSLQTGGPVDR
ncbi:tetratricopeptide repeat protein [Micromonospora radicis]|nr:ATP-binding protein [Micromonospora radicis]